jgi:23S rRNA (uridine2552-2'-O)-methyltransferase
LEKRKNRFNKAWMHEHVNDRYVQEAKRLGYRARAAFKLLEIDARDRLLQPGQLVVDLGAAPGSWSQAAAAKRGNGRVIALDLLPVEPIPGVEVIQGDFSEPECLQRLEAMIQGARVDLVLSDMAPNLSGVASVDQARAMGLADLALEFAAAWLKPQRTMLVKVFQGEGFDDFRRRMHEVFARVAVRKPKASRDRSNEVYLLGQSKRG